MSVIRLLAISLTIDSLAFAASGVRLLLVTKQEPDFERPWATKSLVKKSYLAFKVGPRTWLTTASAMMRAREIKAYDFARVVPEDVEVIHVDHVANLARIRIPSHKAEHPLKLRILGQKDLGESQKVQVYLVREAFRASKAQVSLADTTVCLTQTASYPLPCVRGDFPAAYQAGAPVMVNGEVVGMLTEDDHGGAFLLPSAVLRRYLKDDPQTYGGFPTLGVTVHSALDKHYRSAIGIPQDRAGAVVTEVVPGSKSGLEPGDFVYELGGTALNGALLIDHKMWGPISFVSLLSEYRTGDVIPMKIIRHGEFKSIRAMLSPFKPGYQPIPSMHYASSIDFYLLGGLVLQDLSLEYLKTWGKQYRQGAPSYLLHLLENENNQNMQTKVRFAVISNVLSDPINNGYRQLENQVVRSVDGVQISAGISQIATIMEKRPMDGIHRVTLAPGEGTYLFRHEDLEAANSRIIETYGIRP